MHPALTLLAPKLFSLGKAAYQQVQLIHELKALPHRQALERFDNHVGSLTAAGRIGFAVTLALQVNQEKDPQTRSLLESMQARLADTHSTGSAMPAAGIASIEPLDGFAPSAERPDAKAGLARWVATESDTERRSRMANHLSGLSAQGLGDFATELNAAKMGCEERIQYHRDNEARIVAGRFFEDQMPYKMLVAQTGRHDPQWQRTLDALEQERDRFGEAMSMAGDTLIALLEQSHRPHEAHCGQKVDSVDSAHPDDSATEKAGEKRGFKRLTVFVSHCWKDKVHPHFGELCAQLEPFTLWIDKTGIDLGDRISEQVNAGIRSSEVMVLLWSAAASRSGAVCAEIEAAHRLGKTIIPCLVDDTPLGTLPQLEGRLAIDLTQPARRVVGWQRLIQILIRRQMQRLEQEVVAMDEGPDKWARLAQLADMKQRCAEQEDNLQLLQDSAERIGSNAADRNRANPYMLAMCRNLAAQLKQGASPEGQLVGKLMPYVEEVFTRLPDDDEATIAMRNTLFAARIQALDPSGQHPSVRMLLLATGKPHAHEPESVAPEAA